MTEDLPTIMISPSEIATMRQCPLKHQLAYDERWTKERSDLSHPLAFGTLWHLVIQTHREVIRSGDTLYQAKIEVGNILLGIDDPEVVDLLSWMYMGYVEKWGADLDWEILAIEFAAEVELPPPPGVFPQFLFRLKLKLDLLVRWQGRIWVVDEKSCKTLPKRFELDLDDQFGLYYWAVNQLGYDVFGAIYSASRKERLKRPMTLDERFDRILLSRGRKELDTIALEAWQTAHSTYSNLTQVKELRRTGLRIDAPRHPDPRQCGWKCDWTEACIAGRKGVDLRDYLHRKHFFQDFSRH